MGRAEELFWDNPVTKLAVDPTREKLTQVYFS